MPYYNRKVKSLDIESINDHTREKIKIELDDFKVFFNRNAYPNFSAK